MPRKRKHVRATRNMRTPPAAGVLVLSVLLMTVGDVASAQASTANILAANTAQSILSPIAVDVNTKSVKQPRVVTVPSKPDLRSPCKPPSWTPGPPPWAPGQPNWVPGPPPWASPGVTKASASVLRTRRR